MKSWSTKRSPCHYNKTWILRKVKARLRSKLQQLPRMLKSNTFCHLVLPMPLLHHLTKALMQWPSLEFMHLPITALKQFSSMEHYLQRKTHHMKLECNTVRPLWPPSRVPTSKHCTAIRSQNRKPGQLYTRRRHAVAGIGREVTQDKSKHDNGHGSVKEKSLLPETAYTSRRKKKSKKEITRWISHQ